jgi:hypothetical protein
MANSLKKIIGTLIRPAVVSQLDLFKRNRLVKHNLTEFTIKFQMNLFFLTSFFSKFFELIRSVKFPFLIYRTLMVNINLSKSIKNLLKLLSVLGIMGMPKNNWKVEKIKTETALLLAMIWNIISWQPRSKFRFPIKVAKKNYSAN